MNVDAHFFWDIEELLWDYFSIRNHHKIITIIRSQISQKIYIISNTSWRKNRNIVNRSKQPLCQRYRSDPGVRRPKEMEYQKIKYA